MNLTINGKEIKLSGKGSQKRISEKIGFKIHATEIRYDGDTFSYTESAVKGEETVHEFDRVDAITEYDNAVYIYAYHVNGYKARIILDKE